MTYQALARKWRPRNFEQMVGQEMVVTCLKNALNSGQLHHAYLFTGSRGVGKTSIARIFAKGLNCVKGTTSEPCNQCINCQAFNDHCAVDLLEIDAASKTKVEDTRDLLSDVRYPPVQGRFKIYLIDEVHMLSSHSFNALLKTLEEPPPYVKFLFATTEPEKIPLTILSRCLVFNLPLVETSLIQRHLANLLTNEKIEYEEEALALLAKNAAGSVRDAISLLDQALTYGKLSVEKVSRMLGWVDRQILDQLVAALVRQENKAVLKIAELLYRKGCFFDKILDALLEKLYALTLEQFGYITPATSLSQVASPEQIQLLYQIALIGKRDLPFAPDYKIGFEMTLLRMLHFQPVSSFPLAKSLSEKPQQESSFESLEDDSKTNLEALLKSDALIINKALLKHEECTGILETLVKHSCFIMGNAERDLVCQIDSPFFPLLNPRYQTHIENLLAQQPYGHQLKVRYVSGKNLNTIASLEKKRDEERHSLRQKQLTEDPNLQNFLREMDGEIIENERF